MVVKWWAVFSSRLCCSLLLLLQHCPCTFPFTVFLCVWFPCGLCLVLLPEHLGGCSAKAWKTPPIRTQMCSVSAKNTEQRPEGHLPRIGLMNGDDATRPQLGRWCVRWPAVRLSSKQGVMHDFWHKGVTQKRDMRGMPKNCELGLTQPEAAPPTSPALPMPDRASFPRVLGVPMSSWQGRGQQHSGQCIPAARKPDNKGC